MFNTPDFLSKISISGSNENEVDHTNKMPT